MPVTDPEARIGIWAAGPGLRDRAEVLADDLDLPLVDDLGTDRRGPPPTVDLVLAVTAERLELRQTGPRPPGPVFADFSGELAAELRQPGGGRRRDLGRAVGLSARHAPDVFDATAGLGRDAFRLAGLGCRVTAAERHPVVAALLRDGLQRARSDPSVAPVVESRLALVQGDSRELLTELVPDRRPAVVLIDPMYPASRRSAAPGREMRLFRRLLGADHDAVELLRIAREAARQRVVVKRRSHDAPLGEMRSDLTWLGRSVRFDVYLAH
jgi:16S rRNA (guanine1516-N2)-methyltransferase